MKRNILTFVMVCLVGTFSWGAKKKFIALGDEGKTVFKSEVTLFEADEDPQPKCIGCKNYRVIIDILDGPTPAGGRYPSAVDFDTKDACGEDAVDSPMAELNMLYPSSNSPLMTRSHPLLLVMNPALCKGEFIKLYVWSKKCINPMARCSEFEQFGSPYLIPIADLKDLKDINLDGPFPNMKKGKKIKQPARDPSSVKPPKK